MGEIEGLLTIDEVCAWLKITKSTMYKWVATDEIPSCKIGGKRRFEPNEIRKWIKRRSTAA